MKKGPLQKQKTVNSHSIAMQQYLPFTKMEKRYYLPKLGDSETIIVRLDGKGMTKKFLRNNLISESHFSAMKQMMQNIVKHCPYIAFAYSTNDEVSFVIKDNAITSNQIERRAEKLLSYLSGFVSSLYSLSISDKTEKRAYSFDSRAIIVKDSETLKNYYCLRQKIAIGYFIEKLCTKNNLPQKEYTIDKIKEALRSKDNSWDDYPPYVPWGYVGFYNNTNTWIVEIAKSFETDWDTYTIKIKE